MSAFKRYCEDEIISYVKSQALNKWLCPSLIFRPCLVLRDAL